MIIFDLDGTLWDTSVLTYEAATKISEKYDDMRPISMATIQAGMGLNREDNAKNYMPYLDLKVRQERLAIINEETIRLINTKGAPLYPHVKEVIMALSKKYPLGIVTNNNDDYIKAFLKETDLAPYFIDYIGALSYNISKSLAIQTLLQRNNYQNGYYVGDTKGDMISANDAGVSFIHAKYGFDPNLNYSKAIHSLEDLLKMKL